MRNPPDRKQRCRVHADSVHRGPVEEEERYKMRLRKGELLLPLVYTNLVLINIPFMYCQLVVSSRGSAKGLSSLQLATLFCNGPVLLSFLGSYCKNQAERHNMGRLLCLSTGSLALLTSILSLVDLSEGLLVYLVWMLLITLISISSFFSQLACYAILSKTSISFPPSILLIDISHAVSASVGMFICYYFETFFEGQGLFLIAGGLIAVPPFLLWLLCIDDSPIPELFVKDIEDCPTITREVIRTYFDDERLKNDLVKEHPYLLMENESFGKNLIDTDAQVIILMNIIYVVTVALSQGVHCFFLVTLTQRSNMITLAKCCFLYSAGVIISTALCAIARPFILSYNTCNKVVAILYLAISNIVALFLMSNLDAYIGKYVLSYCVIITNCQLSEEVIDSVITTYYDNILLPALKSFSVRDYINAKVGFLHGLGALAGPFLFGLIATDMEIESMLFTIAAIFTTLAVVTTPLSLLFVAAGLR